MGAEQTRISTKNRGGFRCHTRYNVLKKKIKPVVFDDKGQRAKENFL